MKTPKPLSWLMIAVLLITWSSPPGSAFAAQVAQPDRKQAAEKLERLFNAMDEAAGEIPRDSFDAEAIVKKVGRDPVVLFGWVRDNTYLVPYRGSLRGPVGVLMDRLGNSLDRALLLSELLRLSGEEVRLARGAMSNKDAEKLLSKARPVPAPGVLPAEAGGAGAVDQLVNRYAEKFGLDRRELQRGVHKVTLRQQSAAEDLAQRVSEQAAALSKLVGEPEKDLRAIERARAVEALQDHWWVRWKQGASWIDLDPSLPDAKPGNALAKPQKDDYRPDALEDDLHHRVTIRVVVEQSQDGKLQERKVIEHTLRPSALIGERIALQQVPMNWPEDLDLFEEKEPLERLQKVLKGEREWLPVLTVGSRQITQYSFTDSGEVKEKPGRQPAGEAGSAVRRMFGPLGGALSGREEPKEEAAKKESRLTAEWIEYEIGSPGQQPRKIRRQLFDLVGPAARSERKVSSADFSDRQRLERALGAIRATDILLQVCDMSPALVAHLTAKSLLANRGVLLDLLRSEDLPRGRALTSLLGKVVPLPGPAYFLAASRQGWNAGAAVFLDRVNILSYVRGLRIRPKGDVSGYQGFDIVANEVGVWPGQNVDPFFARLQQGVRDTNAEAIITSGAGGAVENTAELFAASRAKGINWVVLRGSGGRVWNRLALSRDVRARTEQDLAEGYVLIVPSSSAKATTPADVGWWRTNPENGSALGIGEDGSGGGLVEKVRLHIAAYAGALTCVSFSVDRDKFISEASPYAAFALCMFGITLFYAAGLGLIYASVWEKEMFFLVTTVMAFWTAVAALDKLTLPFYKPAK